MSGLKTTTKDLAKSWSKMKAIDAAAKRKAAVISELRSSFMRQQGCSYLTAHAMAEVKYNIIHNER